MRKALLRCRRDGMGSLAAALTHRTWCPWNRPSNRAARTPVGSLFFGVCYDARKKDYNWCLLAVVFVLSILDYGDAARARPAHQVSRDGKNQSQSKSEKSEGPRPRAAVRGTGAATSSTPHLDSKPNPIEPASAIVNRQEGQRFHFPPPLHLFTAIPRPLARRDLQPPVRNSIGVSVPSNPTIERNVTRESWPVSCPS
jgi:hypothetical protein